MSEMKDKYGNKPKKPDGLPAKKPQFTHELSKSNMVAKKSITKNMTMQDQLIHQKKQKLEKRIQ